jgi:hypothetical protein
MVVVEGSQCVSIASSDGIATSLRSEIGLRLVLAKGVSSTPKPPRATPECQSFSHDHLVMPRTPQAHVFARILCPCIAAVMRLSGERR